MGRGFILGAICGSLASLALLALVSVLDQVPGETPPDAQTDAQVLDPMAPLGTALQGTASTDVRPTVAVSNTAAPSVPDAPSGLNTESTNQPVLGVVGQVPQTQIAGLQLPGTPDLSFDAAAFDDGATEITTLAPLDTPKQDAMMRPAIAAAEPEPVLVIAPTPDPESPQEPQSTQVDQPEEPVVTATAPNVPTVPAEIEFIPAVEAFAVPFDLAPTLPIVSFVLLDDADSPIDGPTLAALPFPVTLALDASDPRVGQRAVDFSAAGIEVAVTGDAPLGADISSIESAYLSYVNAVPTAVAVVGGQALGLRGGAARLSSLRSEFLETGHGYLALSSAAASEVRRARTAGIPAATVYSDLDAENRSAVVMRRFIDQAAFKSRKEGIVILLARLSPDTLVALATWGQKDRSSTHNIAPLSSALLAGFSSPTN